MTLLMDPVLAASLLGYPLHVESAPCYNCGKNIELDEPVTFTREAPFGTAEQWKLRAQVAAHSPECLAATNEDLGES